MEVLFSDYFSQKKCRILSNAKRYDIFSAIYFYFQKEWKKQVDFSRDFVYNECVVFMDAGLAANNDQVQQNEHMEQSNQNV